MTKHCIHAAPYESIESIRLHFDDLRSSGVTELTLTHPIDSSEHLLDVLRHARDAEISIAALHASDMGIVGSVVGESPLARLYRPHDPLFLRWVPLKTIVYNVHLQDASQYYCLIANVRECAHSIRRMNADFYVSFRAEIAFSYVDGGLLADLLQHLVDVGISSIDLRFDFPDPSVVSVGLLRRQLAELAQRPIARHEALCFSQLPFCFLPPSLFRPLYRALYDSVPEQAHFQAQRALIRDIRSANNQYHVSCQGCRRRAACYRLTRVEDHAEYQTYLVPAREATVAFVGASLSPEDRREFDTDDVVVTSPAQQGDGIMAVLEGFKTILLFDGYFFQRYALTTFELLTALVENINVFGSSSLGALRGLELSNYGMRADGYVYRFLRGHKIVPYHVVAQSYDEEDRPVTEALITIYRFLELAVAEGVIDGGDSDSCYTVAEGLHFSQLTYHHLFDEWAQASTISSQTVQALREFLARKGVVAFDVKRQDALALLRSFRVTLRRDGPNYTVRTVMRARDRYLSCLRLKYEDHFDSSLAPDWRTSRFGIGAHIRERPLSQTIELAEKFFADLDVVVAETSALDQTCYFMINVVFVPFYFLSYGNSVGSGYGESREKALASAYGEVLERIPLGSLRTRFADRDEVEAPKYPFGGLPFYQTMDATSMRRFVGEDGQLIDRDYIECTDILGGGKYALPKHGARGPSSLGMAVGNTMLEAVLYGLYEVIEHDISAAWQTSGLSRELHKVNIDLACNQDKALGLLVADLMAKGHQAHFFNLLNSYGIPTVLSAFYEADRRLVFTGIASRLDLQHAVTHSFHEALNGHFVSYFGSRDDRRGFEQKSLAEPGRFLDHFVGLPRNFPMGDGESRPLAAQLDEVLDRLQQAGVKHVLAIDLSPKKEYNLSAVKIVVPGMSRRRIVPRTPDFYRKCLEIQRLVTLFMTGVEQVEEKDCPMARLEREFSPPVQRFFKA